MLIIQNNIKKGNTNKTPNLLDNILSSYKTTFNIKAEKIINIKK